MMGRRRIVIPLTLLLSRRAVRCSSVFGRLFLLASICGAALPASAQMAHNPLIWADVPDVSILRVGDDFYMSSTTMHMSPGLPIMASKDLVNWRMASYAYDTLADNEALRLENGQNAYGRGSWASSIRFHDGMFYVSTFSATSGKTHIYTTRDPVKQSWQAREFSPSLHDSSLFFDDDGKVYMAYGGGDIRLVELKDDLSGIKEGGFHDVIIKNASAVAGPNVGLNAEGSQLYKHDGKYYLFNITWPRGGMRTEIVHRADKITGPYEGRVVLADRGIAQGSVIETAEGKWYGYMFQDHGAVGRIPYLVPMTWEDGWPVLGVDGKVPMELDIPAGEQGESGVAGIVASDEFDRADGDATLPMAWQWNHNPDREHWSLTARPGFLRLTTGRVDAELTLARNTLTQRTYGPVSCATVALDVSQMKDGDVAGLAVLQRKYGFVGVTMKGGAKQVVMTGMEARGQGNRQRPDFEPVEQSRTELGNPESGEALVVYLRIECNFQERADTARFYYSLDGKTWGVIGEPLKMEYTLPHFMGYRFGLFNFATETPGGYVDFDFYRLDETLTAAP
jgi:beta-xylosidase